MNFIFSALGESLIIPKGKPQISAEKKIISELKDEILPAEVKGKFEDWIFGCDVCQDVCPWNRFSVVHNEPQFIPDDRLLDFSKQEWMELTEEIFQELFKKSAVKRTKYHGLKRNINFVN